MVPRVSMQPEARRRQLVEVAATLFVEHGFAHTSVADIVRRAGVAQGTFYYHFRSKDEVAEAVVDHLIGPLLASLSSAADDHDASPSARLIALVDTLLATIRQHTSEITWLVIPGNELLHTLLADTVRGHLTPLLASLIEQGRELGELTAQHPRATAELLLATVAHVTAAHADMHDPDHLEALRASTKTVFVRALGAEPATPG